MRKRVNLVAANPKISFLIPIYNKEAWAVDTIESLRNQTLKDIEIVFLDDGSTDATPDIIRFFQKQDDRIRLYQFRCNKGLGKAWNYVTAKARSNIICVASGDDIYDARRAEVTYRYFQRHKSVDVFYTAFYFCDSLMRRIEYKPAIPFNKKRLVTPRRDGFCPQYIGHATMAYKKDTGLRIPYRENLKVGIDYPFLCDLANAGCKFGWSKYVSVDVRLLKSSVSQTRRDEVEKANKSVDGFNSDART